MPAELVDRLNKNINTIIADPAMKTRFVALGAEPEPMTPSQFGALIGNAAEKWAKVITFASVRVIDHFRVPRISRTSGPVSI